MPTASDWRSPQAAAEVNGLDYPGFAQEFLRRNPDYRRDHASMVRRIAAGTVREADAQAELARRWGLVFPCRSRPSGERPGGALAHGTHPHRCRAGCGCIAFCRRTVD